MKVCILCMNCCFRLTVTNMEMMQTFKVMPNILKILHKDKVKQQYYYRQTCRTINLE